ESLRTHGVHPLLSSPCPLLSRVLSHPSAEPLGANRSWGKTGVKGASMTITYAVGLSGHIWSADYGKAVRRGVHFSRRPRLRAGHAVAHDEAAGRQPIATEWARKYRRLVWGPNPTRDSGRTETKTYSSAADMLVFQIFTGRKSLW